MSQSHLRSKVIIVGFVKEDLNFDRSPVFHAMFIHNMTESQQRIVDIEDLDYETVKDMLR